MNVKTNSTYGKEFATPIAPQPLSATKMATSTVKHVIIPVLNVSISINVCHVSPDFFTKSMI
jgi:hypothetical protein